MKKTVHTLLSLLAATFVCGAAFCCLYSCGKNPVKKSVFTDSYGRPLYIDLPANRVVSAAPNITECFFVMGLGDLLVGRTDYCEYPPEAAELASIGDIMEPSLETIIMLEPDLVIASSHFTRKTAGALEKTGIPVAVLKEEGSVEGLYKVIKGIGILTGYTEKSDKLIKYLKKSVKAVTDKVKAAKKPKVYYVVGFGEFGDYTAGGDTFIHDIIELAGGTNIAADVKGWSFNLESLVMRDPDIIVCPDDNSMYESFIQAEGYKDLRAVSEGRVYTIDRDLLELQGPRMLEGVIKLAEMFHPELF